MTFSLNLLSIGNKWGPIQSPKSSRNSNQKSKPKFNSTQSNLVYFKNAFMFPLGVACYVIVGIDDRGRVRCFVEPI
jgi:hypothetical protein